MQNGNNFFTGMVLILVQVDPYIFLILYI